MKKRVISMLLVVVMLVGMIPSLALTAMASESDFTSDRPDAMEDILSDTELSAFKQGATQKISSDGYIGIPVEVTVYYDYATHGAAVPGYWGTPVILYVVNTMAERVGTMSDVDIILSMLERGYAVAVTDYLNSPKAISPALEWSAQLLRGKLKDGAYFTDKTVFPAGTYYENHVAPAGCDVSLSNVFYEIDKHGVDGTLERTVEAWNYDFRSCYANTVVKWVDGSGNRKATQKGWDGSSPVWYADAAGKVVDNENGQYIKVNHTWAKRIEDCVKQDGSPIDFNLYMHIIYPTNPENEVPVMVLSGSLEHLATGYANTERPHTIGFAFNGYAAATFDFEYVPMARNDHYGYFAGDASKGVSTINATFALGVYSIGNFNTAAIRYLRYLSYTQPETYKFDDNAIGMMGNSKGGNQTFMGAASLLESKTLSEMGEGATIDDLREYVSYKATHAITLRYLSVMDPECQVTDTNGKADKYYTFDGDSRYENGFTEDTDYDGYHVDGGELQPWLTYTDENGEIREIVSGVQLVYSSCSGTTAHEWEGMSPVVTTSNLGEYYGSAYNTHNYLANFLRLYDVPSLYLELPIDHSLLKDKDIETGVDAYVSYFKFCDYYLKGAPVSVLYVDAANGERDVDVTEGIVIKFLGEVSAEEISKVSIVDENGNAAKGEWVSAYGKTQWTFVPNALNGGVRYTVTVPADVKGANGKAMGESYVSSFYTKPETAEIYGMTKNVSATSTSGAHFSFTVPAELPDGSNRLKLRFRVANEAANIAQIYEASSATDTTGKLIGSINLKGAGYYEYDVTNYVMSKSEGEKVYFYVKAEKAAADTVTYSHDFDKMTDISAYGSRSLVTSVNGESITALRHNLTYGIAKYGVSHGYSGWYPTAWENNKLINGGKPVTEADYGRTFTVTLKVMATASRPIQVWMSDCTSADLERMDYSYSRVNVIAPAGEWIEISLPYTVYEMDYGVTSQTKILKIIEYFGGSDDMPVYYDSLTVTEHITDIEISEASLVSTSVGNGEYKAPESDMAFEVDGKQYATWWEAVLASDKAADHTVKLLSDHEFTSSDNGVITALNTLNVDLNGYTVSLTDASLLNIGSVNKNAVRIEVSNGNIAVSDHPLITHSKDTADGEGKFYEIAFKNVYIDVVGGNTRDIVADFGTANSRNISRTITFEDCIIEANRRGLPKYMPLCLFPGDGSEYQLIGGEVVIDTFARFSLVDDVRTLYFAKNGEGEYTEIKVADIYSLPADMSVISDKGYAYYVLGETADGYKSYELTSAKYSTPYGIIPDDKSPEEYPFALFVDGELIGLYSSYCNGSDSMTDNALYGAFSYIRGEHNKEVQIYLRRDYDISSPETTDTYYKNLSQIGGTLVLHLGEYELTLGNVPLFNCDCKYGWDKATNTTKIYDTKIIVKGGMINANNASVINYSSLVCSTDAQKANYNRQKLMDITFEDTVINTSVPLVRKASPVNEQYGALLSVDFNGCEINLSSMTSAVTLFNAAETLKMNDLKVRLNGGNITAKSVANITLLSGDAEDSVIFSTDKYGEYTTLTMPKGSVLTGFGGMNDKGAFVEFGDGVSDGTNTVYTLAKSDNITKYGAIPNEYASVEDYPFAVFSNGQFVKAFQLLINNNDSDGVNSAFEQARSLTFGKNGVNAQILMRRDYACTSSEWGYNNLSHMTGDVTIDLGGYTLTTTGGPMLQLTVKTVNLTNLSLINGTLITKQALVSVVSLINANYNASAGEKIFNFNFEDLNIVYGSATYQALIVYTKAESGGTPTKSDFININVNNCKLDISALGSVTVPLVVGADKLGTNVNNINVTVNGGSLVTSKANVSLGSFDPQVGVNGDSLRFGKGANGYMEMVTTSAAIPTLKLPTVSEGELSYGRYSSEKVNGVTTYVNRVGAETEYGVIPFDYDAKTYPFAVFKDGVLLGAYSYWSRSNSASALWMARSVMVGSAYSDVTVQILMRSDYTTDTTKDEWYANLAHFGGTVIVDLGGHNFTADGRPMFVAKAHVLIAETSKFIVKNGTLTAGKYNIINANTEVISSQVQNYISAKIYDFTFENVDFMITGNRPILQVTTCNHENGAIFNVTLNDCTIDATKATSAVNIFSCNYNDDTKNANVVNLRINGGSMAIKDTAKVKIYSGDAKDSLIFGKGSDGKLTVLTLPAGVVAPNDKFNTTEGVMVFTATNVIGRYELAEAHVHSYTKVVTAPTCIEGGYTTYTCTCGDSYVDDYTEAIGHAYDDKYDADCNNCGEIRDVEALVTVVAEGKCGVNTTWVLTSDGVLTISGNGDTEDYLVSITTEQPYRAYADKITKVVIEDGVTSIGRGAFYGFTNITEVVFPESLIAIHEYAFFGCTAIKTVTIPENTFYIGMYAFRKSGLTEMTFANAEGWTFADGTALDVTNVKAFTTEFTYKQTCIRPIYEDGEVIANGVFGNKEQFSWTLTSTGLLTVSGNGAMPKFNVNTTPWYGYRGAIRSVVIEEGITSVGRCSFHTCRAITSVTLPESLETIAEYAFYNCQFLTEATIPANVTRIEIYAFRKCYQLKNVTFTLNYGWTAGDAKVSATELNSNAADMLTLVNYTKIWTRDINAEEEVLDPNYVTGGACNTTVKWFLTYTDDTKTSMKLTISGTGAMPKFETAGTPWYGYLNDIVEVEVCEGITEIGRCSFYGLKFVKVATIADTVTSINDYAFNGCFSLKSIEIPESVTFIADTAFTKTGVAEIPTV